MKATLKMQSGSATAVGLIVMIILGIVIAGLLPMVSQELRAATTDRDLLQATYAAEAGVKRAQACFQNARSNGVAPDWNWLQTDATILNEQNIIDGDSSTTYSVLIRTVNQDGAIVPIPAYTSATNDLIYYIQATGKAEGSTKIHAITVTLPKSLPSTMQFVYDAVTAAVDQAQYKNWARNPGLTYNDKSWNGIAELLLQEGVSSISPSWKPKYDGSQDRVKQWGSNWHYGYNDHGIIISPIADSYAPNQNDFMNFTNVADYYTADSDEHKSNYSSLDKKLWDGKPTVYAGGTTSLDDFNKADYLEPYFPPWVLLTAHRDFRPQNIMAIINNNRSNIQRLRDLKCILGTIVVYRADRPQSGDPTSNPVQIYKINVDMATKTISMSEVQIVGFP